LQKLLLAEEGPEIDQACAVTSASFVTRGKSYSWRLPFHAFKLVCNGVAKVCPVLRPSCHDKNRTDTSIQLEEAMLSYDGIDTEEDVGKVEQGADCRGFGFRAGCVLVPGELQLDGLLTFFAQGLASWKLLKGQRMRGLGL
jgi:hypothetical protein